MDRMCHNCMLMSRRNPAGQGLLEMIFAIGILLLVVVAILALASSGLTGVHESEFQIIANNLGRESIEVVRSIRDRNWLSGLAWDTDLAPTEQAITVFDPSNAADPWSIVEGSGQLYQQAGLYLHADQTGPNATPTLFRRSVKINSVCQVTQNSTGGLELGEEYIVTAPATCGTDLRIGALVTATVQWTEANRQRHISLQDVLYAWR